MGGHLTSLPKTGDKHSFTFNHLKLTPGWALIRVNFDAIQEIELSFNIWTPEMFVWNKYFTFLYEYIIPLEIWVPSL